MNNLKKTFCNQKMQVLQINEETLILKSDNSLFNFNQKTLLNDIHPFFYTVIPLLPTLQDQVQFPCVNIVIEEKKS